MTGQDLASKLKALGISEIKSHMTAMDDALLLRVQGMLEAHGISTMSSSESESSVLQSGGLTVKRRKKRKPPEKAEPAPPPIEDEPAATEPAPEPEPTPAEATPAPEPEAPAPTAAEEPAPEPEPAPAAAAEPSPPETSTPDVAEPTAPSEPTPEPPAPEPEPVAESAPAAPPKVPEAEPEPTPAEAESTPEATETPEPQPAASKAEEAPKAEAASEKPTDDEKDEEADDIVRPSAKRRAGKVVGFVDLSKIQTTPARKNESRRLRSKDDITPDVQPTLGHDRRRAFMRGDHASRGSLTAGQLREKEAGRFLRRRGGGPGGRGGGDRRGPRVRQQEVTTSPFSGGEIRLEAPVTIKKLAEGLALKVNQVMPKAAALMGWGITNNTVLDEESAVLLAGEFNVELKLTTEVAAEEALLSELAEQRQAVDEEELDRRPPVVAFMGHVDHGKTTLLDTIRSSRVQQGEAGGITQHLGAYQVETKSGNPVTILDTPGHEAFTAMRARGAQATDIAVLVVAADDGVMPSTVEAINHVNAANEAAAKEGRDKIPIVVAINKCDKPDANPEKVRTELAQRGLNPEEWGGETAMVQVSALQGTGIDELLERIFLESEVLEHNVAHHEGAAEGLVLEAEVQEGKGKVAYLLVQDGTLKQGDIILAGEGYGRVRSIHNDLGKILKTAGPSTPVEVSGLSELPTVGEKFHVVAKLDKAKDVAEERARKNRELTMAERNAAQRDMLLGKLEAKQRDVIHVIVKADVQGSLQAIVQQLAALKHDEVEIKVLHSALGAVTESDVDLARPVEDCTILAFNTGVADKARIAADRANIEIRHHSVIYELLDEMRQRMEGTLAPEFKEEITGHAEIKVVFASSKFGRIAGCMVLDGKINRNNRLRILRNDEVVHTGTFASIRREKDEVKEVREGFECGMLIKNFNGIEEGDVIEAFKMVEVKRLLKI